MLVHCGLSMTSLLYEAMPWRTLDTFWEYQSAQEVTDKVVWDKGYMAHLSTVDRSLGSGGWSFRANTASCNDSEDKKGPMHG